MHQHNLSYQKVKKKYLRYIKSQEILSEPFRNKINQLNSFYLPVSKMIYKTYFQKKKTQLIGLAGGQGSGKSTISNILKIILKEKFNLETVIFSIDDFYKTLKERKKMSKKISPLFLTRGVPGTHDTKILLNCLIFIFLYCEKKNQTYVWQPHPEFLQPYNVLLELLLLQLDLHVNARAYVHRNKFRLLRVLPKAPR